MPTLALFPWGDLIEDYLDTINLSLEAFCHEMTGGWMFGYVEALKGAGFRTVIFCVSAQVKITTQYTHKPTGAVIYIFPTPRLHRWARSTMQKPYGWKLEEVFGVNFSPMKRPFLELLRWITPYLANPVWQVAKVLQREGCSALLCQEYEYARFDVSILLGKLLRLPVFATFQGGDFQFSKLEALIRPHTLKRAAGLIVGSQVEVDRLHTRYHISPKQIAKIFNPLDLSLWQPASPAENEDLRTKARSELGIPSDAKVLLYHGRMELYRKGLDVLMDAWEKLCQEYPEQNWWLLLVGTGSDAPQLRDRIRALPKQNVCWVDQYILDRSLLRQYICAADLYTLPSRHEGFPVALLEAMACGLPVVATNVPGVSDILVNGNCSGGIIVPIAQPIILAETIAHCLNDNTLRLQLAKNALSRVESCFSLESVGEQLQKFFALNHVS